MNQLLWSKVVYLVSDLAMGASGVLAAILVFKITAHQQKKHATLILQTPNRPNPGSPTGSRDKEGIEETCEFQPRESFAFAPI